MLDFPNSPTTGQKFPQPAVAGVPVYTWDGVKWTTVGGSIGIISSQSELALINAVKELAAQMRDVQSQLKALQT